MTLCSVDLAKVDLHLVMGKNYKDDEEKSGEGAIPASAHGALLAAFNGGFQQWHEEGGFVVEGKERVRLSLGDADNMARGKATLLAYDDGRVEIANYTAAKKEEIARGGRKISCARQNCPMLIEKGKVNGLVKDWGLALGWKTVADLKGYVDKYRGDAGQKDRLMATAKPAADGQYQVIGGVKSVYAWRSAVGVTPDGRLVYGIGPDVSAQTLAWTLQLAGCADAMHLDMNISNLAMVFYDRGPGGGLEGTPLDGRMWKKMFNAYLKGYTHDFFYLTKKAAVTKGAP